jgi:hypothetical protein
VIFSRRLSGIGLLACPKLFAKSDGGGRFAKDRRGRLSHKETDRRAGQASTEFALLYTGVILPLTFMLVFVAEMLWIWHSVVDFTRYGARYASTHCWETDGSASNVIQYMESNVPPMIDMNQFQTGAAGIQVSYFTQNTDGTSTPFDSGSCSGAICVPDTVSVSITSYQFTRFSGFLGLPSVTMPPFTTSVPMESAGYSDASGTCAP